MRTSPKKSSTKFGHPLVTPLPAAPIGKEAPKREILVYGSYAPVQRVKPSEGLAVQTPTRFSVTRCSTPDTTSLPSGLTWTHVSMSPSGWMYRSYLYSTSPG